MAAVAINSSTFSYFSSLPPELSFQIWRDVLPDKDGPALYFYRMGCWLPRQLSESNDGYGANVGDNINLEFRHDFIRPCPCQRNVSLG
jgi:hypothetical protein